MVIFGGDPKRWMIGASRKPKRPAGNAVDLNCRGNESFHVCMAKGFWNSIQ